MKAPFKLPAFIALLSAPLAAYADSPPSGGHILTFVSAFGGGLLGALLACWLCNRSGSKNDTDSKR